MDIIVLGSGTAIPSNYHSPTSILIRAEGVDALLDLGPGALKKAAAFGLEYLKLETVFLTHLHSDHTLDLVTFLQANDSTPNVNRLAPLKIYGCVGTQVWYQNLMITFPGISPSTYPFSIEEKGESVWKWGRVQVSTFLTRHTEESLAYRFDGPEGSFVFTGDTIMSDDLIRFCNRADLLISECSFPAKWNSTDHMSADQVGNLAEKAVVKQLVVTHQYPPALREDIANQIGSYYSGVISLAVDGSTYLLSQEPEIS